MKRQAFNPYLPSWEYVPDGEPHIFNDRLYVFGSHDAFDGETFCVNNYVCWSAPLDDLGDWRFEGYIYDKASDPLNPKNEYHMNAPDVCRGADGRYYLYYQLHRLSVTSVAVAGRPEGPYTFYGHVRHPGGTLYGKGKGDAYNFDPGLLVDDDGRVYLYTGFSPDKGPMRTVMKLRGGGLDYGTVAELEPDMLTIKGVPRATIPGAIKAKGTQFEGHGFYEARIACHLWGKAGTFAYTRPRCKEEGFPYFTQSGADRDGDGDQYIAGLRDGAAAGFKYFRFDGRPRKLTVSVRGDVRGRFAVLTAPDREPVARIPLQPAVDWAEFSTVLPALEGDQALYFRYEGAGAADFSAFRFDASDKEESL